MPSLQASQPVNYIVWEGFSGLLIMSVSHVHHLGSGLVLWSHCLALCCPYVARGGGASHF